jgi:hypothetical protein
MQSSLRKVDPPPKVIVDGITDSLAHLFYSFESGLTSDARSNYISLALDALIENMYQCYEITIMSINREISVIRDDPQKARYCINMDYNEFNKQQHRFNKAVMEAKKAAGIKSDTSYKAAIKEYNNAIDIGEYIINKIDWIKVEDFGREMNQQEKKSLYKDTVINLLTKQISQYPKRSAFVGVIIFFVTVLLGTLLEDLLDKIIMPQLWQYVK